MARDYTRENSIGAAAVKRMNTSVVGYAVLCGALLVSGSILGAELSPSAFLIIGGLVPAIGFMVMAATLSQHKWIENERQLESERRGGKQVLGNPPDRTAFEEALKESRSEGKVMIDRYLVGFELDNGKPIWVSDDEICSHGAVFAKTGVGKTLWLEGLMFQQMARGRASGFTFIDAKRDPGTLADIILMALITGRIEDLLVVDPFDPVCAYNFVFTTQRPDVKARKVLRCGLPPTTDQSTTKHYDRLAADAVYRVVRAMESLGLAWSVRDIAVALSAFTVAYPRMRALLHENGSKQAMVELGHLAGTYRTAKGSLDSARLTDNLRGIASELHSISNAEAGEMFCVPRADLSLTDSILRGKLIYYMLPRLEEAESAARMVKVFREDLEVSIGEVTSSRYHRLEDPHMVMIDEGASTFGPTWANLFELARKGRFSLLFGAQSVGGLMDETMGLSEQFYERVMANVNLKVIMRVGDNRTALDMSEWIGKVTKITKSVNTAVSTGVNARELTKNVEINKQSSDTVRDGITLAEDEEDLVSQEELKHEMSAEKGLAWFDKGDGRLRKGRAIWFDNTIPSTWEGREFLTKYESVEADEIGLAEWVDEHIFSTEQAETERSYGIEQMDTPMGARLAMTGHQAPGMGGDYQGGAPAAGGINPDLEPQMEAEPGTFRLNLLKGFGGKMRSRTYVRNVQEEEKQAAIKEHNDIKPATASQIAPAPATTKGGAGTPAKPAESTKGSAGKTQIENREETRGGNQPKVGPRPQQNSSAKPSGPSGQKLNLQGKGKEAQRPTPKANVPR